MTWGYPHLWKPPFDVWKLPQSREWSPGPFFVWSCRETPGSIDGQDNRTIHGHSKICLRKVHFYMDLNLLVLSREWRNGMILHGYRSFPHSLLNTSQHTGRKKKHHDAGVSVVVFLLRSKDDRAAAVASHGLQLLQVHFVGGFTWTLGHLGEDLGTQRMTGGWGPCISIYLSIYIYYFYLCMYICIYMHSYIYIYK